MNTSNSSRKMLFIVLMIFFASSTLASLQNKELGNDLEKRKEGFYSEFLKKHEEQIKPRDNKDFIKTVAMFKEKFLKELDSADWVGEKDINGQKIQKVEMSDDAEIVMFTDLHSCAKALKQFLALMHHRGETEKDNIFKLKEGKKHLAFLGDYVDRGKEGVDVIQIIFNLFIHNPKKVFLLRGNHEDKRLWEQYGFKCELKDFGCNVSSSVKKNDIDELGILEKLPSLLTVVHQNDDKKRVYLFGHGMASMKLKLDDFLNKGRLKKYKSISKNFSFDIRWSDVSLNPEDDYVKKCSGRKKIGKNIFSKYCKEQSKNSDVEIVGMFRGHQHSDFKFELGNGNGLYLLNEKKQWDGKEEFFVKKIKPFIVTAGMFRYSDYIYGIYNKVLEEERDKATIVSLKLDKDFKKCKITGEVMNRVQEEKKK